MQRRMVEHDAAKQNAQLHMLSTVINMEQKQSF